MKGSVAHDKEFASQGGDGITDRAVEPVDQQIDFLLAHDEGRREQDMVTIPPIHRAAHRVNHQAMSHGLLLDACMQFV